MTPDVTHPAQNRSLDVALQEAQRLANADDHRAAIDLLTEFLEDRPTVEVERMLVKLRHEGFSESTVSDPTTGWPRTPLPLFTSTAGLPEIRADELTADHLSAALQQRGALLVRGLVHDEVASHLVAHIDLTFDAADAVLEDGAEANDSPWFTPFQPSEDYEFFDFERRWVRQLGGVLAAESPRTLVPLISALRASGLGEVLADYLGEWPALSVKKTTLRRTSPDAPTEWHQDGSFLGTSTRTVNVWLALSTCGEHAPSLDIVPQRLDGLVETGTHAALFDWSVGEAAANHVAAGTIVRPHFEAGDAVLFDGLTLHRTGLDDQMTQNRYAVEAWFFAPGTYPKAQIPLLF